MQGTSWELATGNARVPFIFHPILVIFAVVAAGRAVQKGSLFSVVRAFVVTWTDWCQGLKQAWFWESP